MHPLQQLYSSPVVDPSRLTLDEAELRAAMPALMSAHGAIKAASEEARAVKAMGSSLQCSVVLESGDGSAFASLDRFRNELEAMFVVSSVEVGTARPEGARWAYSHEFEVAGAKCRAWVLPPRDHKCPRCWRYVAPKEEELCGRCEEVVGDAAVE